MGMASLSLPTIPVLAEEGGVGDSHPLLYVRWHEHDFKVEEFGDAWWFQEQEWTVKAQDMRKEMTSLTGVQFFSPTGVSLPARTCETNQTQRQVGGDRWTQIVPDL